MTIDEKINVSIGTKNIKHFRNLGYCCKIGDIIQVAEDELNKSSTVLVTHICDCCGKKYTREYRKVLNTIELFGLDICPYCAKHDKNMVAITVAKQKQTYKERTGYETSFQNPLAREKGRETMLEKFGVENAMFSNELKEKMQDTVKNKYGVDNISQLEEIKKRKAETCFKNFGVEHPSQNEEIKNKQTETCLKNHGVEHPSQNQEIKEKQKETCLKKYGVEYPMQSEKIQQKAKETCIKKYKVVHPMKTIGVKQKVVATLEEHGKIKTSFQQVSCYNILKDYGYNVELNYPVKGFALDILLKYNDVLIDIEYDGSYWHQDKQKDRRRDEILKKEGYKIIRINSDRKIPTLSQLQSCIDKIIVNNYNFVSIDLNK